MSTRPLRILHLTAGSDAGGLSRYIHDLCQATVGAGHEVAVAGERGAWHWLFEHVPWPWIDAPMKGGPLALWHSRKILRRFVDSHPVDILHAHYRRATMVGRGLQHGGSGGRRPPLLYTLHLSHIPLNWPRRWLTDFGDHTHVASAGARQWLMDEGGLSPERITVIPHGIDPHRFCRPDDSARSLARGNLGIQGAGLVAAYVGRLDYPKNEAWLVDLAEASRQRLPHLRIVLAGDGPNQSRIARQVVKRGLGDRITLLGHRDPLLVYHAADALLLPSAREGFSLVCIEAMSTGIPVLRTRTSGSSETIVEGVTGRTVAIDRDPFIAAAMDFLSDLPALRRMGAAAAEHVRQHLTFQRQFEQTLALYQRLAAAEAPISLASAGAGTHDVPSADR